MGELKPAGALFVALALLLTFVLPRRWAALPLLAGALHVPFGLGAVIGPFHVYVIRLLLVAALLRLMVRREGLEGRLHALDAAMLVWATWAVFASVFHDDVAAALKFDAARRAVRCARHWTREPLRTRGQSPCVRVRATPTR